MTRRPPFDALTGLDALAEIGRRLGDLPDQVKAAMQEAGAAGGASGTGEKHFTIDTPAGPLKGVASFRTGSLAGVRTANAATTRRPLRPERPARAAAPDLAGAREPMVDCFDEGDEIVITAELPGVRPEEVALSIEDGALVIRTNGERRYHARQELSADVIAPSLAPELRNGILSVRLQKAVGPEQQP
jgi:HSP20 family molecular chaperone IbpA